MVEQSAGGRVCGVVWSVAGGAEVSAGGVAMAVRRFCGMAEGVAAGRGAGGAVGVLAGEVKRDGSGGSAGRPGEAGPSHASWGECGVFPDRRVEWGLEGAE